MRGWAGALRVARAELSGFRERFDFGGRDVASWFPGHMAKGLRQMRASLRRADCLIEVHDARIPLSGRNPMLQEVLGIRPHILVLNKMDLADPRRQPIVPLVAKLVGNSPRYHRAESTEYSILVIGVPNVGKSSLINSLRRLHLKKGKATVVGGEPGITKAVLTRIQVCEKPLMYLVDTPGVLPPKLGDMETGMKLALCGAIRDHLVGEDIMADYLLYILNKQQQFRYVQHYGLAEACDDIKPVLKHVALARGRTQKVKVLTGTGNINVTMLNYPAAAYEFLRDFRAGRLGRVTLD
ncbi:mitochondrial ribosome-associated GTPase 1 isoform X2 [Phalacrocorax carbo]|uniref:mitochondrial ribosome-associated GTPase 1 isoform X2 n=1 Tax=Phalacrocorax carbo TaxID=9209 RepID=UPI003119CE72